jgi:sec-independent protein translocase protein TatA
MTVGIPEILVLLLIVLLILGPRRIADLGRALGRGVRDLKLELGSDKKDGELPEEERQKKPARKR